MTKKRASKSDEENFARQKRVGILTVENIGELLALEAAGREMDARCNEPRA